MDRLNLSQSLLGKAVESSDSGAASGSRSPSHVEEMMGRLRLTEVEAQPVVLDDAEEDDLVLQDCALIGKVLSPNTLHIQTIESATRPAWGNPRGLLFHPAGDNLFIVEFGTRMDRDRIMEGSPWVVGKHAVLLNCFDANIHPLQVRFDRLAIWANIMNLPPRLMKSKLGLEFAKPIGTIKRVESDADGCCWGASMRVRVEIDVHEPLVRYVTVTSIKLQTTETYTVKYERLPFYCFSCGLLGHSSMLCPNPGARDVNGDLPYASKKLCMTEDQYKRSRGTRSRNASSSSRPDNKQPNQNAPSGGARSSEPDSHHKEPGQDATATGDGAVSSMLKRGQTNTGGRGRSSRGRGNGRSEDSGKELFPFQKTKRDVSGHKRKLVKDQAGGSSVEGRDHVNVNALALVPIASASADTQVVLDCLDGDSNKKQRISTPRSTDPAAAVGQPRQTQ